MSGFDLAAFDGLAVAQEQGIDVEIKGPDGKKLGADGFVIKVAGPDSSRFNTAIETLRQEREANEDLSDEAELSREEIDQNSIRILARCTISWTSIVLDGAALECSEANAIKLYARFPFIRQQVERRAGSRKSFMPRSAKSSAERSSGDTRKSATASPQ